MSTIASIPKIDEMTYTDVTDENFMIKKGDDEYVNVEKVVNKGCTYTLIYGKRSNGKTYGALEYALKKYFTHGKRFVYIRRWQDDLKTVATDSLFDSHVANGLIKKLSKGRYNTIIHKRDSWYMAYDDGEEFKVADQPFAFHMSLTTSGHTKSRTIAEVGTIIFDEFIPTVTEMALPDEFSRFMNTISTITRNRDDIEVIMCANTVNKKNLYFDEMGLKGVERLPIGSMRIYTHRTVETVRGADREVITTICTYYSDGNPNSKSSIYFNFRSHTAKMITKGDWDIPEYPKPPKDHDIADISYAFYIEYQDEFLKGDLIDDGENLYIVMHNAKEYKDHRELNERDIERIKEIADEHENLIYNPNSYELRSNRRRNITVPKYRIEKLILDLIKDGKIYFTTNDIGSFFTNYWNWCISDK